MENFKQILETIFNGITAIGILLSGIGTYQNAKPRKKKKNHKK